MSRDIAESRKELDYEQSYVRRTFGRQREQQSTLEHLGLSEKEAVEYVLMLSRDEEEARRQSQLSAPQIEEGLLVGEFDDIQTLDFDRPIAGPSRSTRTPPNSSLNGVGSSSSRGLHPLVAIPTSNIKVQVSPRYRPETMEAGGISPLTPSHSTPGSVSSSLRANPTEVLVVEDQAQFPSISSTPTTSASSSTPPRRSVSGSLDSSRTAWSTPLRTTRSEGPSSPRRNGSGASSPRAVQRGVTPGSSFFSSGLTTRTLSNASSTSASRSVDDQEAEDLRYAIELSLAEARSRGEGI